MKLQRNVFMIISKDEMLVAKENQRDRYICHKDEQDKKRFLTYSSKGIASNALASSGFFLSERAAAYIAETYPECINQVLGYPHWSTSYRLFEVREFTVEYTLKE